LPSAAVSTGVSEAVAADAVASRSHRSGLLGALVALDALGALLTWFTVLAVGAPSDSALGGAGRSLLALTMSTATMVALGSQSLYRARTAVVRSVETLHLLRASVLIVATALIVGRVAPELSVGLGVVGGAATFVVLQCGRSAFANWVKAQRRRGHFVRPVLLIGANEEAARIAAIVRDHRELGYTIVGVVGDRDQYQHNRFSAPWLGPAGAALFAARSLGVTGGIITPSAVDPASANRLARELLQQGLHVQVTSGLAGIDQRRLRVQHLMHEPMIYVERAVASTWERIGKRVIDIAVSGAALVIVAPVMACTAIAVRCSSPGPIVFRQVRSGRHGQPFTMYKFRTMVDGAEELLEELTARNERRGPLFKLERDPRETRVGRILRKASLDELPQLFNVLRGDMSLVGPRPALPSEVADFDEELLARMTMPPGITGLWQIEARDNPSFDAYRRLDLFYVENWSLGLDVVILGRTAMDFAARALRLFLPRRDRQPTDAAHETMHEAMPYGVTLD
jgi:exopolysaccharide biosynthesis polyprenyl glycosylphosphotransferase